MIGSGGYLTADDVYGKKPMKGDAIALPAPAEVHTLAAAPASISLRGLVDADPLNVTNHMVPMFTKLGCNSGGCHGKSGGQNGFALSLLGFVPEMDYVALVKEARGRRLFPASPEHSLLLTKAAGIVAHAGGKRMEV